MTGNITVLMQHLRKMTAKRNGRVLDDAVPELGSLNHAQQNADLDGGLVGLA